MVALASKSGSATNRVIKVLNASDSAKKHFGKSYFIQVNMQATILVAQQKDDLPQGRKSQILKLIGRVDAMIKYHLW